MDHRDVAIWIDAHEARIFWIQPESFEPVTLKAPPQHLLKHPRGPGEEVAHPNDAKLFFHDVLKAVEGAEGILIVGPSTAKLHLMKYVSKNAPALESKIVGVETVDHPSDGQLAAYARTYFAAPHRGENPFS